MAYPEREREDPGTPFGGGAPASEGIDPLIELVERSKAGDNEAVRQFLESIAPLVRRTCAWVLGGGHPELEDAMQECLYAATKSLGQYRFDGDVRHYVTKICLRIAITARKRSAARARRHDSIDSGAPPKFSAPIPPWSTDDIDLVRRIVHDLSGVQSEAILMRIVLGFSIEEIATMTGVSRDTVRTRLRLGKNALRAGRRPPFWKRWLPAGHT